MYYTFLRYFGLSSTGITYKSGSASYGSSSYYSSDSYQGQSTFRSDRFRDRSNDRDSFRKEKDGQDDFKKSDWATKQDYGKGSAQNSRYVLVEYLPFYLILLAEYDV